MTESETGSAAGHSAHEESDGAQATPTSGTAQESSATEDAAAAAGHDDPAHADDDVAARLARRMEEAGRRIRRRLLSPKVLSAIVAAVVAACAAVWITWPSDPAEDPEELVSAYMEAVRTGDLDLVEELLDVDLDRAVDVDASKVLRDDWTVEDVVVRNLDSHSADVDVVVRADDGAVSEGRFKLELSENHESPVERTDSDDEERWHITNPLVELTFAGAGVVELNGADVDASGESESVSVLPGAYRLYESFTDLVEPSQATLIGLPEGVPGSVHHSIELEVTDAGTESARTAVADFIDECAAVAEPDPEGCPFNGGVDYYTGVEIYPQLYEDVEDLSWTVLEQPEVDFVYDGFGFEIVPRSYGVVELSGHGEPRWSDADQNPDFSAECDIDVSTMRLGLESGGEWRVSAGSPLNTCNRR